jgi:hypothetical protein
VDTTGYAGGYSAEVTSAPDPLSAAHGPVTYENRLRQNVPNPFNPVTTIAFSVAERGRVRLAIYDVTGRRVRALVDEALVPDRYEVRWDGRNDAGLRVSSGVYFYKREKWSCSSSGHARKPVAVADAARRSVASRFAAPLRRSGATPWHFVPRT